MAFDIGATVRNHCSDSAVVDFDCGRGCTENVVAADFRVVSCRDACRCMHSYGELRDRPRCCEIGGVVAHLCQGDIVVDVADRSDAFTSRFFEQANRNADKANREIYFICPNSFC